MSEPDKAASRPFCVQQPSARILSRLRDLRIDVLGQRTRDRVPTPGRTYDGGEAFDFEFDGDVDLRDFAAWQPRGG